MFLLRTGQDNRVKHKMDFEKITKSNLIPFTHKPMVKKEFNIFYRN